MCVCVCGKLLGNKDDRLRIRDSKLLSRTAREALAEYIKAHALAWSVAQAEWPLTSSSCTDLSRCSL